MHILEIPSFFPPLGGAFSLDQAKALQAHGHEVRMIVCNQLGIKATPRLFLSESVRRWEEEIDGILVYRTNMYGMPQSVHHNQKRWCRIIVSMYHDYVAKYGKPDILHAHCCKWAGIAASMIAKEENIPFYITEHLSSVLYERDFGREWDKETWARELITRTYHEADCVIPVSEELVSDLERYFGRGYRYVSISNIIDTDFFRPVAVPPTPAPFVFSCAAVMLPGKGYDVLLKAFRIACQRSDKPMELHIAGRGTDGNVMRRMITEDIKERVVIHGNLDCEGVRKMLHASHCFVLATHSEAQPLAIMEALACGLPYISTEAIPQCLRLTGSSIIVPIDDAVALADAMLGVVRDNPSMNADVVDMRHEYIETMASSDAFVATFNTIIGKDVTPLCER